MLCLDALLISLFIIGNTAIMDPIVNLTGMSHPGEICKRLDDERKNSETNEGLYSRFMMCCPEPVFSFADDVEKIRDDLPSFARYIVHIFQHGLSYEYISS